MTNRSFKHSGARRLYIKVAECIFARSSGFRIFNRLRCFVNFALKMVVISEEFVFRYFNRSLQRNDLLLSF